MSGVRDRIEGGQYQERQRQDARIEAARQKAQWERDLLSAPTVRQTRTNLVVPAQPTASTRDHASAKAFDPAPERLTPPAQRSAMMSTISAPSHVPNLRERLERQEFDAREEAEVPTASQARQQAANEWLAYENNRRAQRQREEAEAELAQIDRAAREKAREAAERAEHARNFQINLAFDSAPGGPATPAERQHILSLPAAKDASPEQLVTLLTQIRDLKWSSAV